MTVKQTTSDFVINMDNWTMGEYADYFEAGNDNRMNDQFELAAKVVEAWPFSGSPKELKAYRALSVKEYKRVLKALGEAVTAQFAEGN